jgi:hypothetical protein
LVVSWAGLDVVALIFCLYLGRFAFSLGFEICYHKDLERWVSGGEFLSWRRVAKHDHAAQMEGYGIGEMPIFKVPRSTR